MADRATPMANTSRMNSTRSAPIRPSSTDFSPYLANACKIVGASADAGVAAALRKGDAAGAGQRRPPRCARRPIISTSPRPASTRAHSCRPWPSASAFRPTRSPPSATCRTTSRCSASAALRSRWAMPPTTSRTRPPTSPRSNEQDGFAEAMEMILKRNGVARSLRHGPVHAVDGDALHSTAASPASRCLPCRR